MTDRATVDGILVQWGDRLFYPGNRIVASKPQPKLRGSSTKERADWVRARISATVVRRAPQVMVKVTGGGKGMKAIAAHFRYISKHGRLDIEDQNGTVARGRDSVREMAEAWRWGGRFIQDVSTRREAFNIILSMPRGSAEPLDVQRAARAFAKRELEGHAYVMVLHDHQANPHVHLSVRAEGRDGRRLNPRKADLRRWRETFAEQLRELGIDAEASRQATRGRPRQSPHLWQLKAQQDGRPTRNSRSRDGDGRRAWSHSASAWNEIVSALATSPDPSDRALAVAVGRHVRGVRIGESPHLTRVPGVGPGSDPRGS